MRILRLNKTKSYRFVGSHGEEIRDEGGKSRREATLGDEAELEFGKTNGIVTSLPVPTGNIQQVSL